MNAETKARLQQHAFQRGAQNYRAGIHANPFHEKSQGHLFKAWAEGYAHARGLSELNKPVSDEVES